VTLVAHRPTMTPMAFVSRTVKPVQFGTHRTAGLYPVYLSHGQRSTLPGARAAPRTVGAAKRTALAGPRRSTSPANSARSPPNTGYSPRFCQSARIRSPIMADIHYRTGDATNPQAQGPAVIARICNDRRDWGKGFVLAISQRWPQPETVYRRWHRNRTRNDFGLGATQLVRVAPSPGREHDRAESPSRGLCQCCRGFPFSIRTVSTAKEIIGAESSLRSRATHASLWAQRRWRTGRPDGNLPRHQCCAPPRSATTSTSSSSVTKAAAKPLSPSTAHSPRSTSICRTTTSSSTAPTPSWS
jgi:hypothetical protein